MIPDSAECTTTGRKPSAMRARSTCAMLCQLAGLETLVPPNLSTSQASAWSGEEKKACDFSPARPDARGVSVKRYLIVLEYIAQFLL